MVGWVVLVAALGALLAIGVSFVLFAWVAGRVLKLERRLDELEASKDD